MIFAEPFRINRGRKGRTCAIDQHLAHLRYVGLCPIGVGLDTADAEEGEGQYQKNSFHTLPPISLMYFTILRRLWRSGSRRRELFERTRDVVVLARSFRESGGRRRRRCAELLSGRFPKRCRATARARRPFQDARPCSAISGIRERSFPPAVLQL